MRTQPGHGQATSFADGPPVYGWQTYRGSERGGKPKGWHFESCASVIRDRVTVFAAVPAAGSTVAQARMVLGEHLWFGDGVAHNVSEAKLWLLAAWRDEAESGDASIQFALAVCYRNGRGIAKSVSEGNRLYELAAAQGHIIMAIDNLKGVRERERAGVVISGVN